MKKKEVYQTLCEAKKSLEIDVKEKSRVKIDMAASVSLSLPITPRLSPKLFSSPTNQMVTPAFDLIAHFS